MLCVRCLICTVMMVEGYCLLMQEMLSTQLIVWLHYGMLEFFGLSVITFCLFVQGSDQAYSKEGVMQGDPLSMMIMMYAVPVFPLTHSLVYSHQWIQNWYDDDSSCIGKFSTVRQWLRGFYLMVLYMHGYFPEPTKTLLVVQSTDLQQANVLLVSMWSLTL